jgi:hypothetical protein
MIFSYQVCAFSLQHYFHKTQQTIEVPCELHRFFIVFCDFFTFSSMDLWIFTMSYILHTICYAMNSSSTYSSITSHYPLKLLLALTCGVHLVNTIYEEYFVFSWMPQQYPKKILVIKYPMPMCWKLTKLLVHVWLSKSNIPSSHCIETK